MFVKSFSKINLMMRFNSLLNSLSASLCELVNAVVTTSYKLTKNFKSNNTDTMLNKCRTQYQNLIGLFEILNKEWLEMKHIGLLCSYSGFAFLLLELS